MKTTESSTKAKKSTKAAKTNGAANGATEKPISGSDQAHAAPTPSKVAGVKMSKVVQGPLREMLHTMMGVNVSATKAMTDTEVVTVAVKWFKDNTPANELADCDVCGGASDVRLDVCPFCGVGENDAGNPVSNDKADKADDNQEANVASKKTDTKKANKKSTKAEKAPKADKLAKAPKEKAPLVLPEGVTVEKLDTAVADVAKLKGGAAGAMWELGKRIADIYDGQLWKARSEDGSTPAYKHWNAFCLAELNMVPANAYNLMDVAKAFSREKVIAFGTTKLGLILKAPESEQPALLKAAETHSKRELSKKVDEAKKKAGGGKRKTGRKETPAGVPGAKGLKTKKDSITVANILKTTTVPLFCRPGKGEMMDKRAKKVGDVPVGKMELANGVTMWFNLIEGANGELAIKVAVKRDAE